MGFEIGIKDIIDIFLVAILLYQSFRLLKKSGAVNVFIGILTFLVIWFLVSYVFRMELLGSIFDRVVSVGTFALIVLFQEEIRRFFSRLGATRHKSAMSFMRKFFSNAKTDKHITDYRLAQLVLACRNMARNKTGALIVITRNSDLDLFVQSGEKINANISSRLIETIFFKNSPLHDGAMIISDKRIRATSCIIPISRNQDIPKRLGLRHRAALGITENSDAIAVVVSEETGQISWAINGNLVANVKPEQLEHFLSEELIGENI